MQLMTYARVVQKQFGAKAENIRTALYYLEGAELISTKFIQKDLDGVESELLRMYKLIESIPADEAWGHTGNWCRRCDYKTLCPFIRSK